MLPEWSIKVGACLCAGGDFPCRAESWRAGERKLRVMLYNGGVMRISVRPDICHGKPCIKGTRIQVAQVLDLAAAGKTFREIIADYFPDLTEDDVRACLEFARDLVQNEDIHVVEEV